MFVTWGDIPRILLALAVSAALGNVLAADPVMGFAVGGGIVQTVLAVREWRHRRR